MSTRRQLLKTLSIGAGVAPVVSSLGRAFLPHAHAATGGGVRRIIFFENPNGLPDNATPAAWFYPEGKAFADAQFGHILQPLERHRKDMVVLQNLEPYDIPDFKGGTASHRNAAIQLYTGCQEAESQGRYYGRSRNASVDLHLSETVGAMTPRFPFLMTGTQCPGATHTYNAKGDWLPNHNQNPYDLYAKLFANFVEPGKAPAMPNTDMLARLAMRKSALDHVSRDLTSFQKTLGKENKARAETQLQAIRTLETRLGSGVTMPGAGGPSAGCKQLNLQPQALEWKYPNSKNVPQITTMMNDLVVAALACDMTRVVTMMNYPNEDHGTTMNFDPVNSGIAWHSASHGEGDPGYVKFRLAKMWASGVVADLADKLKQIPEGSGSMLDNTLILMAADHGIGHQHYGYQLCTIGGRNLGVNVGSYLKCGERRPNAGMRMSRFLVSLLNIMGVPAESFGALDTGKGPLPGFAQG